MSEDIKKSIFISASSGLANSETTKKHTGMRMPKPKKQADPFGKPSLFFKSEFEEFKHPTLCKLRDLLQKHRVKAK